MGKLWHPRVNKQQVVTNLITTRPLAVTCGRSGFHWTVRSSMGIVMLTTYCMLQLKCFADILDARHALLFQQMVCLCEIQST